MLACQTPHNLVGHSVGARADLLGRLILNRMGNVDCIEAGASQGAGLDASRSCKFRGRDRYGGYTEVFEMDRVVQTARCTRSSIRKSFDHCVQAAQLFDDL